MIRKLFSAFLYTNTFFSRSGPEKDCERDDLIDLGYTRVLTLIHAKHVPTRTNITSAGSQLLNYNNIRYAEPPTGEKRFRKPVTPPPYQPGIQDGNRSSWETDCLSSATLGAPFPLLSGNTWGSEDCLLLNVIVPKGAKEGDRLPVLHWTVGSAFAFGGKDWTGFGINTYGLFDRHLNLTDQFIIVTHNYRLGILGWLPKFENDMNGNIGVWDSLAAIEWTKQYIHKFGGDPDRITVIGQSAGAAIVTDLLLGEGGNLALPFDHAMISSPALPPRYNLERSRPVFDQVLNATGCETVECMRHVSEAVLKNATAYIFSLYPDGGGGTLGPGVGFSTTVDGELLSELPTTALAKGHINKNIKSLIVGNNANEGDGLSSDFDMPERFPAIVRANIPNVSNESIAQLRSMYQYPADLSAKLAWDYTTDIVFGCPAAAVASAYGGIAHRYLFSIPPAYHGKEITYFFFADNTTTPIASSETAYEAQRYLLQFMFREDFPVNPKASYAGPFSAWPTFSPNTMIANITVQGFEFVPQDGEIATRCAFINELEMDPANGV